MITEVLVLALIVITLIVAFTLSDLVVEVLCDMLNIGSP